MYHLAAILKSHNIEKLRNSQIVIPAVSSQIPKCTTELKLGLYHVGHGQLSLIHGLCHSPDSSAILNFRPHSWNPHNLNVTKSYKRALKPPKIDCISKNSTTTHWYTQCITFPTLPPSWIWARSRNSSAVKWYTAKNGRNGLFQRHSWKTSWCPKNVNFYR